MRTLAEQGWLRNVQSGASEADIASRERKKKPASHICTTTYYCVTRLPYAGEISTVQSKCICTHKLAKGNSCSTVEPELRIFKSNQISFIVVANAATTKNWFGLPSRSAKKVRK